MNRTDALIKGLQILRGYDECELLADDSLILAGPQDHRDVTEDHAKELDELGWFATSLHGFGFTV